jgi:hypothetical protein
MYREAAQGPATYLEAAQRVEKEILPRGEQWVVEATLLVLPQAEASTVVEAGASTVVVAAASTAAAEAAAMAAEAVMEEAEAAGGKGALL